VSRWASRLAALAAVLAATPVAAQLDQEAQRAFSDYRNFAPHRAFVLAADGKTTWWAGASGADPATAVERALKRCADRNKADCTLYAVNNILVRGADWKSQAPPLLPAIGRLRPQPFWLNNGPQAATGLIVWSHGYMLGRNATASAPYPFVGRFTASGYDLYRFDREYIRDWPGDATALADAVRQAKSMGYRRVVLAGQSAGGWASLAATMRCAPVDGVISVAAAHHGQLKDMRDTTIARSEWRQIVQGIKPGPRLVVVNFAEDTYDVGGRMDDAKAAFSANKVDAVVIADPEGFKGHGAGSDFGFTRKFGACITAFIESGVRQAPCG
jgi:pimeloyl-ACP methyl ester carboxylesterase